MQFEVNRETGKKELMFTPPQQQHQQQQQLQGYQPQNHHMQQQMQHHASQPSTAAASPRPILDNPEACASLYQVFFSVWIGNNFFRQEFGFFLGK